MIDIGTENRDREITEREKVEIDNERESKWK